MTVITGRKRSDDVVSVNKPEELESIVRTKSDKLIYFALKNINFTYEALFAYLTKTFYAESMQISMSRSAILSELMEVSESTFYRWRKSKSKVDEKYAERLSELIQLYTYGEQVFESRVAFLEWLSSPNIHTEMKAPIGHLDSTPGIRYIKHLLDKIEFGAPI
jgi:putative toxin-antitoxin system antitoxin component (TIGR02293 family)